MGCELTQKIEIPTQEFDGKTYYLYPNQRYFSRGTKRMHRVVWEYHNGKIPKGFHIHHINGDSHDNRIDNLQLMMAKEHLSYESKRRIEEDPEWFKEFNKKGREASKEWHKSEEGRKFHSEIGKKSWENKQYTTLNCQVCGKEYQTPFPDRSKYCHLNCRAKALRDRRKKQ